MKEKCEHKWEKYIFQSKDGDYYNAPRVMEKCHKCGTNAFIQKLPTVDYKIEGSVDKLL